MEKSGHNSNSPVGVLEDYFRTESDSNSSKETFHEEQKTQKITSRFLGFINLLRNTSKKQLPSMASFNTHKLSGLRCNSMREEIPVPAFSNSDSVCKNFTLSELQFATKNFSQGSKGKLSWSIRYKIALGIAEGLMYLHYGCQRRIIHRDIKAANILLTEDFEPQICDFGLAKWLPDKWTHHIVLKFEGTFGYLAPEFMMHGIVDEKTDVFAFGVLLLELITGRRALDCSQQSLVMWAKPLLRKNNTRELIDPALDNNFNSKQMKLVLLAAALCVQRSSIRRPSMNQVLQLLKGNLSSLDSMKKYKKPSFWKMYYEEMTDS